MQYNTNDFSAVYRYITLRKIAKELHEKMFGR